MRLSKSEFRAMQSLPRRLGQRFFELPMFQKMGMELREKDVLEIGCGSGYGAHLIGLLRPRSYVGVDIMAEQIELARAKYPQFRFLEQDAKALIQFSNESLDAVIIFGVLHHIPNWRSVLDEVGRVLKRGGSLHLEEPRVSDLKLFDSIFHWAHPDSDFGLMSLEAHLSSRGFTIKKKHWTPLLTMYHILKPH